MVKLSTIGWGLFWFFSMLSVVLAYRFVPDMLAALDPARETMGLGPALYQAATIGIRDGFEHVFYHLPDRMGALFIHMLVGSVAMVIIPFQLWTRFRMRNPGLHRWMGRVALVAILFSGYASIRLALNMEIPAWGATGFVVGAFVWIGSALWATWHAMRGNITAHRWWMVIVAAMTFGAVMIRLEFPIWRLFFPFEIAYAYVAWSSWVLNLVAVALWRARHRLLPRRAGT
ncbi:MAG: DUF2306 domain-containing protein [Pseudomonadota bacterium]